MLQPDSAGSKQRRALKACDFCHKRGRRCRPRTDKETSCLTCESFGVDCTWSRISAKRGAKSRRRGSEKEPWSLDEKKHGDRQVIQSLLDNFFECVYPVACVVFEEQFMNEWHTHRMPCGRASFARLMAICALSAQRIAKGATLSPASCTLKDSIDSRMYFDEAISAIPAQLDSPLDIQDFQALAVASLAAMECGAMESFHRLIGLYHTALARQGLTDEKRWPEHISPLEREERRRLHWYMYRLEVHSSLVIGHVVRCPELQCAVAYPTVPDSDCSTSLTNSEWLSGWNFITDLYRGIEHLLTYFKARRMTTITSTRSLSTAFLLDYDPDEDFLKPLAVALSDLPVRFKHAVPVSRDVQRNRCGFQAANIICTYQLLRVVSFTAHDNTFHNACQTALEMIEEISTIPIEFMRAMSVGMLQELAGFGHLLSCFIKRGFSKSDYQHLRTVLSCMLELLDNLAPSITAAAEASDRLRSYVAEIDKYLVATHDAQKSSDGLTSQDNHQSRPEALEDAEFWIPPELLEQIPWPAEWTDHLFID